METDSLKWANVYIKFDRQYCYNTTT